MESDPKGKEMSVYLPSVGTSVKTQRKYRIISSKIFKSKPHIMAAESMKKQKKNFEI